MWWIANLRSTERRLLADFMSDYERGRSSLRSAWIKVRQVKCWRTWLLALLGSILLGAADARAQEIIVSAAASLTDALTEVGRAYTHGSRSGMSIRFNFAGSSTLARQIEQGAPADLFFSADAEKMDQLENRGVIEVASRRNLLSNQLVMAVRRDTEFRLNSPQDLLRPAFRRIAVAQPDAVPAGIYFKEYLRGENVWDKIAAKLVPVLNVRAVLATVESGNVDVGLMYSTDAAISKKVRTAFTVPAENGPKIVYPAALVKTSKHRSSALEFLYFASGARARAIYKKYGFLVLE